MYNMNQTIELLKQIGALTVDMRDAFVRGTPQLLYSDKDAVYMIHGCGVYMLWAKDRYSAEKALHTFDKPAPLTVIHGKEAYGAFKDKYHMENDEGFCLQYSWNKKEKFSIPDICSIRELINADIPFVQSYYHLANDTEYLQERIAAGELYGAVVDGKLAGFIGSHSDGSIGMLEILPEFRRRGLATVLEHYQMNRHMDKGWTPYGQVFINNPESIALQRKIGLEVSQDIICWV